MRSPAHRRWQLTDRDRELLAWIGRWRCVTSAQAAAEFELRGTALGPRKAQRRLRAARDLGLVAWRRPVWDHRSAHHWLTREGMRAVGLQGAVFPPRPAEMRRDLAVVDLALHIARIRPCCALSSERELRARHRAAPMREPAGAVKVFGNLHSARPRLIVADLLTEDTQAGQVATHAHLVRFDRPVPTTAETMLAYATAPHLHGAVYWCAPDVREEMRRLADAANERATKMSRRPLLIEVAALPPAS